MGRVDLEGVAVVGVVVVWLMEFLVLVGQVAGKEAVGCSLVLKVRSECLEVPCCGFRRPQASVGPDEFQ